MTVEFCIVCHNFQRRWAWQLQSILEQINSPEILVNVAYVKGNGSPSTEEVISHFTSKGLRFNNTCFETISQMPNKRGMIRNHQVKVSKGDHLFFADCDVVYSPDFFRCIQNIIDPAFSGLYSCGKIKTTDIQITEGVINDRDPFSLRDSYEEAGKLGGWMLRDRKKAIGGMQVVKRQSIFDYNRGAYSWRPTADSNLGYAMTSSDIWFRRSIEEGCGERPRIVDLPLQFHLNHYRSRNDDRSNNPNYVVGYQR